MCLNNNKAENTEICCDTYKSTTSLRLKSNNGTIDWSVIRIIDFFSISVCLFIRLELEKIFAKHF